MATHNWLSPLALLTCFSLLTQDLSHELAALDQDTVDTKSLEKVKVQLINGSLLLGKDKGVKAYTCCCLADLLRLYAPDCPYEDKELKVSSQRILALLCKTSTVHADVQRLADHHFY